MARYRFAGAALINFLAFALPAIYGTLSKLWIANIDNALIATTDSYTYINTITEVINEGLPRVAFLLIGNKAGRTIHERLTLSCSLLCFQSLLGLVLSVIVLGAAHSFAYTFVNEATASQSVNHVKIAAFSALFSTISTSIAAVSRALDRPDVPLAIAMCTTVLNIVLDFCFLSTFRPGSAPTPTVNSQAAIHLSCDAAGALAGLTFFVYTFYKLRQPDPLPLRTYFSCDAIKTLAQTGWLFFTESAVRNTLYLWLVSNIVALSPDYAAAWGIFNTIRWGLIMVPVATLEATSLTFVGHRWGRFISTRIDHTPATRSQLRWVAFPAFVSTGLALLIETFLCLLLSLWLIRPFAYYLSNSDSVANLTAMMWRSIDWTYVVGYALTTELVTILSATQPWLYLCNSLLSNFLYVLPWAIVIQVVKLPENNAWLFYALNFGGSLIFSIFTVGAMLLVWYRLLTRRAHPNHALIRGYMFGKFGPLKFSDR